MKTLYLDLPMGAAGDMLSAALYELLDETQKKLFLEELNNAGIPGVLVAAEKVVKCGITGTHFKVTVNGVEEHVHDHHHEEEPDHKHEHEHKHEYEHSHEHEHHHHDEHHHHSSMADIEQLIASLK